MQVFFINTHATALITLNSAWIRCTQFGLSNVQKGPPVKYETTRYERGTN
jgi:hypothetical protein